MQNAFSNGSVIFQQDLARCHSSKKVKRFLSDHNISVLDWPGNSPGAVCRDLTIVARSRSNLTTRTTSYSEIALEVVLQVSLLVRLASLSS